MHTKVIRLILINLAYKKHKYQSICIHMQCLCVYNYLRVCVSLRLYIHQYQLNKVRMHFRANCHYANEVKLAQRSAGAHRCSPKLGSIHTYIFVRMYVFTSRQTQLKVLTVMFEMIVVHILMKTLNSSISLQFRLIRPQPSFPRLW